ncbi:hypothetical protein EBZ39_13630 [bacterium]|nr:hypothetical protein [bacterium]
MLLPIILYVLLACGASRTLTASSTASSAADTTQAYEKALKHATGLVEAYCATPQARLSLEQQPAFKQALSFLFFVGTHALFCDDNIAARAILSLRSYSKTAGVTVKNWHWHPDLLRLVNTHLQRFVRDHPFIKPESLILDFNDSVSNVHYIVNWFNLLQVILSFTTLTDEEIIKELKDLVITYCIWSRQDATVWFAQTANQALMPPAAYHDEGNPIDLTNIDLDENEAVLQEYPIHTESLSDAANVACYLRFLRDSQVTSPLPEE